MTRAANGGAHIDDGSDDDELIVPSRRKHASDDEASDIDASESLNTYNRPSRDAAADSSFPGNDVGSAPLEHANLQSNEASIASEDDGSVSKMQRKRLEPFEVPTAGAFYMHDDRFEEDVDLSAMKDKRPKKKSVADSDRWLHDKFEELCLTAGNSEQERQEPRPSSREARGSLRGRGRGRGREPRIVRPPVYSDEPRVTGTRTRGAIDSGTFNGVMIPPGFEAHTPKKGEWNEKLKAAASRAGQSVSRSMDSLPTSPSPGPALDAAQNFTDSTPRKEQNPIYPSTSDAGAASTSDVPSDDDAPPGWTKAKGSAQPNYSSQQATHSATHNSSHQHNQHQYPHGSSRSAGAADSGVDTQAWVSGQARKVDSANAASATGSSLTSQQGDPYAQQYQLHQLHQQYQQQYQQYQQYLQQHHQQQQQQAYHEYSQQAMHHYMSQVQPPHTSSSHEQTTALRNHSTSDSTQSKPVITSKLNAAAMDFEPPSLKYTGSSGSLNKGSTSGPASSSANTSKSSGSANHQNHGQHAADQSHNSSSAPSSTPSYPPGFAGYGYPATAGSMPQPGSGPPGFDQYPTYPYEQYWMQVQQYISAAAAVASSATAQTAAVPTAAADSSPPASSAPASTPPPPRTSPSPTPANTSQTPTHPMYSAASYPSVYGSTKPVASSYDSAPAGAPAPIPLNTQKRPIPIKPPNSGGQGGGPEQAVEVAAKPRTGGRRYSAMAGNLAGS